MPGTEAPGGGTIPPNLCATSHRPDIVILDKHNKKLHIYVLTVPLMCNIDTRHQEKINKYAHFLTDVSEYNRSVNCFEVSSTG